MFHSIIYILFLLLFLYCAGAVFYLFLLSFWGKFFSKNRDGYDANATPSKKIAVLVPAYKEDNVILSTAKNFIQLDYPKDLYDVYIIADSFQNDTLARLKHLPLQVLEVSFSKSTKTKSLNEAFKRIDKLYDVALICDADNILAKDFLKRINHAFIKGNRAVQGRRVAKNLDTSFAILDACSEGINNHIFRKGANAIGLSSSIIGSGMAIDFELIKGILRDIQAVGGFDKILQLRIIQQDITIKYLEKAIVFDEKVESSEAFKQQRKRWLSSQFIYLKQFARPAFQQLFQGNISYFVMAIVNNLILPRAFFLAILPVLTVIGFYLSPSWGIASLALWLLYFLCLLIALPVELINRNLFYAFLKLPKAIGVMFGTLFHVKKANETFIHTVHTKTEISNTLYNECGK